MKSILVCPDDAAMTRTLGITGSPALVQILGRPLIVYWIEHLAERGATDLTIICGTHPELIRKVVADGAEWGLKIDILPIRESLTTEQIRQRYMSPGVASVPFPNDVIEVRSLPNSSSRDIFDSPETFFSATRCWMPHATKNRVAMKEVRPGVWMSSHSRISTKAVLIPPCWIDARVTVADHAIVGPMAVLENDVIVGKGATVTNSIVLPGTFVGESLDVQNSIAFGHVLCNWKSGSTVVVPDNFLLSRITAANRQLKPSFIGRITATVSFTAIALACLPYLAYCWTAGIKSFRRHRGIGSNRSTITYYEFVDGPGYFSRWPQLWNIVRGEFCWFGNRPVSPALAEQFRTDFEKLWLESPIGIFSQADAADCWNDDSEEAKAHACFYSAQRNWRSDWNIARKVFRNWRAAAKATRPLTAGDNVKGRFFALRKAVSNFLSL